MDPRVLMRRQFARWFAGASWDAWCAYIAALFALPMSESEQGTYQRHTGRTLAPSEAARISLLLCGRRSGKSLIAAFVAVYLACVRDWRGVLKPGEVGTLLVIASDRRQARVILRYIKALITETRLREMVRNELKESIELTNGVVIETGTASFRGSRGYTLVGVVADEIAFWEAESDSANADREVIAALEPALSTTQGPIITLSSPYARKGWAFDTHRRHFGKEGSSTLVWVADSRSMNPLLSERVVADAFEADPAVAWSEYGREGEVRFRSDVESLLAPEVIEQAVMPRASLPPVPGVKYELFIDAASGSQSGDSMTAAVAHREADGRVVLDMVLEKFPPFSPEQTIEEFADALSAYGKTVMGDRWGGEWVAEPLRKAGFAFELSPRSKSELYAALVPLLNSARVELLHHDRLVHQLGRLERRVARGGRESIDHPQGAHDDVANAAAGALVLAAEQRNKRSRVAGPPILLDATVPSRVAFSMARQASRLAPRSAGAGLLAANAGNLGVYVNPATDTDD